MKESPISQPQHKFWKEFENPTAPRPIDIAVKNFSPRNIDRFVLGCNTILDNLLTIKPTLIVVPERGASPLLYMAGRLAELRGEEFNFPTSIVPVGAHTFVHSDNMRGIRKSEVKRMLFEDRLGQHND